MVVRRQGLISALAHPSLHSPPSTGAPSPVLLLPVLPPTHPGPPSIPAGPPSLGGALEGL